MAALLLVSLGSAGWMSCVGFGKSPFEAAQLGQVHFAWDHAAKVRAATIEWSAATLAVLGLMAALVVQSLRLIQHAARKAWRWTPIAAGGAVLLGVLLNNLPDSLLHPLLRDECSMVARATGFDMRVFIVALLAATFAVSGLTAAAVTGLLASSRHDLDQIQKAHGQLRDLLMLSTAWLVAGVIEVGALHRLAALSAAEELRGGIKVIGCSSTLFSGVLYSLLLVAVFAPAEVWLRERARDAKRTESTDNEHASALRERGLGSSLPAQLLRIMAMLTPLLAGLAQDIADLSK